MIVIAIVITITSQDYITNFGSRHRGLKIFDEQAPTRISYRVLNTNTHRTDTHLISVFSFADTLLCCSVLMGNGRTKYVSVHWLRH